jgi:hypothetical protein
MILVINLLNQSLPCVLMRLSLVLTMRLKYLRFCSSYLLGSYLYKPYDPDVDLNELVDLTVDLYDPDVDLNDPVDQVIKRTDDSILRN